MSKLISVSTAEAAQILKNAHKIAFFCHFDPDADTVGSAVGLAFALEKIGKTVEVFCPDPLYGGMLAYREFDRVKKTFSGDYDLFCAIDCGSLSRLGEFSPVFSRHKNTLAIDHHMSERFAKNSCLLNYSSTAEIVMEILDALIIEIDAAVATCLYLGIVTDTGNFAHSNTTAQTHFAAAKLIKYIDLPRVAQKFYRDISFERSLLLGRVLSRMRTYLDGALCVIYAHLQDLTEFSLDQSATSKFVDHALNVETAKVAVSLCQHAENVYKVSMRGKGVNVREICERFGGGGHKFAAGCMISGLFEDIIEKIVRATRDQLRL